MLMPSCELESQIDVKDISQDSTRGQVEASTKKAGQHNRVIAFQDSVE